MAIHTEISWMAEDAQLKEKYEKLIDILKQCKSLAVAFSGGVDSTLLLAAAHEALGEGSLAITVDSAFFPEREMHEADDFCHREGIRQIHLDAQVLDDEQIRKNPPDRCYLCKTMLFTRIISAARQEGMAYVAEGSNMDDLGDYRPGLKAIRELGVRSPLREAGLGKAEIRRLSYLLNLPVWKKPSYACLASRIPYGEEITEQKLSMVEKAEQLLISLGFAQMRVRIHGMMARIEVLPEQFPMLIQEDLRRQVTEALRGMGFTYVSMDLQGYRTGALNETLHIVTTASDDNAAAGKSGKD